MYSYLIGDFCVDKMTKSLKKCKVKHKRTLDDYKSYLEKYETVSEQCKDLGVIYTVYSLRKSTRMH